MRERILEAAANMYLDADPEAIKMRELARTIGISSATLYSYFASKDELLKAVVVRLLTKYRDHFMDDLNNPSLTFPEILQRMQLFSNQAQRSVSGKMMDLMVKMYQDNHEINHLFDSQSDFWKRFVSRGREDGYIADDLSDKAVFIYIDMFFQYFRNPHHMDKFKMTPQSLQEIDHELDIMFYRGLFGVKGACADPNVKPNKND
ncbi:nucleoid occlusion factor SlmA [Sporolactobacillus terrae]|uniref:Nucleoid occlusion factor SlmA n=2 Tax=Sporolactobacillus terrae TaxID=269673 RepID=A0ABX5QBC9_9BACL|nr:nucleoid occlusion factor SlmA [Sporolactobacillus terrae]QAA26943.1 nucleoid occlusion factor SlmA [Sporolactobacillus terrae]